MKYIFTISVFFTYFNQPTSKAVKNICNLRGGSRTAATSKMESFVIIVNGFTTDNRRDQILERNDKFHEIQVKIDSCLYSAKQLESEFSSLSIHSSNTT